MKTLLIIILVAAIIAGAVWVGTKFFGHAKDEDKDGIPDKVEDAVDTVKSTAKSCYLSNFTASIPASFTTAPRRWA